MFRFFRKLAAGPNQSVIQSLRISINKLDLHLAVREMGPDVAVARAAIFSGAALTRDFTVSMREIPELRKLLSNDINAMFEPVADAHRAAVIGLAAMDLGESLLQAGTAIDLIFEAEPRAETDDDVVVAVSRKHAEGASAQHAALARALAARLGVTPQEEKLVDLISLSEKRLGDFRTLSRSTVNRPYLDYLHGEIL